MDIEQNKICYPKSGFYIVFGFFLLLTLNFISSLEENYLLTYSSLVPSIGKLWLPIFTLAIFIFIFDYLLNIFLRRFENQKPLYKTITFLLALGACYAFVKAFLSISSIRWQDIPLLIWGNDIGRSKLVSIFWEMFLPCILATFLYFSKIKFFTCLRFIGFSGYIFFIVGCYKHAPYFDYQLGNSPSFNEVVSLKNSDRQVIWIVFDEFDPEIAFDLVEFKKLATFNSLKETGVYSKLTYPPGDGTLYSVPAMLMETAIKGYEILGNQKLNLIDLSGKIVPFQYQGSVFERLKSKGYDSSILGVYHPYCMIFESVDCREIQPFDVKWHSGITRFPTRILNIYAPQLNPLSAAQSGDLLGLQLEVLPRFIKQKQQDLLYIHLLLPHLPANASQKHYREYVKYASEDAYRLNLKFSDHVLNEVIQSLPKDGRKRMLVLTSDHWYRARDPNHAHPILWIAKILNDSNGFENNLPTNSIYTPDLVVRYLERKINNNSDIYKYILNKPNSGTYIATGDKKLNY